MPDKGMAGHGEGYFAVLPDHAAGLAVAPLLDAPGARSLSYASGRPWLIGRWAEDEMVVAEAGETRLAVIGCSAISSAELTAEAERLRDLAHLDRLARRLPGSFHLVAALDGRLRVQGSASGRRLVFAADVHGVVVAADRADLLAGLTGAAVDERQVAVRLLWPVPHPLLDVPMWAGVTAVPAEDCLIVEADGARRRRSRWWEPPRPVRSLAEGATALREALATAVGVRTAGRDAVSCDLSGGLDSTSVCFLAAAGDARVVASTWPGRDRADDDVTWARRAAGHLPDVEHVVWPAERSPLVYERLLEIDDPLDEPSIGMMDRARMLSHVPGLIDRGSALHLTGIGGDHVTWCSEAHYHTLLRTRPLFAMRQLRGFRALWDWDLDQMTRALADGRDYRRYLADAADGLRAAPAASASAALGWGMPPRLFDWVTPEAAQAAREAIREAAERAEPLAPTRGEHVDLEQIRVTTRILRQWDQMTARAGLRQAHPFLDDRVIEACLGVRPDERVTPWSYKPLLVAAMRGVVPSDCLARTSKAQAALDAAAGLREHRGDLLALWQDSRLARLGLVDAGRLRALAQRPGTPELRDAILYSTIGCEVWLRTLDAPRVTPSISSCS